MTDEIVLGRLEAIFSQLAALGGKRETTSIVTNLTVADATPAGLTGYVIVQDNRDGDYIPAKKVPGVLYADSDKVNVLFIEGTEPIAFQQGSEGNSAGVRVSKLVSPDGVTDPVLSADNNGDLTGVGGLALNGASIGNALTVDYDSTDTIPTAQGVDSAAALVLDNPNASGVHTGIGFRVLSASTIIGLLAYEVDSAPDGDFVFRQRDGATSSKETLRLEGATGDAIANQYVNGDAFAFIVNNGSGAAASANEIGYIDENGDYQTTTTQFDDVSWVVVTRGGANGSDIYVTREGRVTIELDGNCSIGDKIYTGTTAGRGNPQTYMRPEMFAVALTANSGGAGGTCEALLYTRTTPRIITLDQNIFQINSSSNGSDSDWSGTIQALPGGAAVRYTTTGGDELNLDPNSTSEYGKMRLHNTTQGDEALIQDNDPTGGGGFDGEITLADTVPGTWNTTDVITLRSQTNTTNVGASRWIDIELTGGIDPLARGFTGRCSFRDSGAANESMRYHPFESNDNSKRQVEFSQVANVFIQADFTVALIQRRFCLLWTASGTGTASVGALRAFIEFVASP